MYERRVIQKMYWRGEKKADIAKILKRDKSTIGREISRNISPDKFYRSVFAQRRYLERRMGLKLVKIEKNLKLRNYIIKKLYMKWSPENISGRIAHEYPDDPSMKISYESIYKWIYTIYRTKKVCFWKLLPRKRTKRYKRHQIKQPRFLIQDKKSIHTRPKDAECRNVLGHWEGDTIVGKGRDGYIVTLVERQTRFLAAAKMNNCKASTCNRAMLEAFGEIMNKKISTITFDNGSEFAHFKDIEEAIECDVFFADPYSSWQRGTNEQTNGLLRRYLPKGTSFSNVDQNTVDRIVDMLNNKPRKVLNFLTPYEAFYKLKPVALEN
jgi:IS30 family transposase